MTGADLTVSRDLPPTPQRIWRGGSETRLLERRVAAASETVRVEPVITAVIAIAPHEGGRRDTAAALHADGEAAIAQLGCLAAER